MRNLNCFSLFALLVFPLAAFAAASGLNMEATTSLLVHLVIVGLIFWVVWWAIGALAIPEPFNKVIRVIIILAAVLFLVNVLMGIGGHRFF